MKLSKVIGNISVLKIKGRIENEINLQIGSKEKNLIFNCEEMNYISSSELRFFPVAQRNAISISGLLY